MSNEADSYQKLKSNSLAEWGSWIGENIICRIQ